MVSLIQLALASVRFISALLDGATTISRFVLNYCAVLYDFVIIRICSDGLYLLRIVVLLVWL